MTDDFGDIETIKQGTEPERRLPSRGAPPAARLVVVGEGTSHTYTLPASGEVLIGRAAGSTVVIDDPSISRRHAVLHVGRTIRIEDVGSANGTFMGEQRIEPHSPQDFYPGDACEVGAFTLFVQLPPGAPERLRRVLPHGYFEARLEAECARTARTGSTLAVGRLHVSSTVVSSKVQEILASELRAEECAASYGPGEYEFLLVDTTVDCATDVATSLIQRLTAESGGEAPKIGVAVYPKDGHTPELLIANANEKLRGGSPSRDTGRMASRVIVASAATQRLHRLLERVAPSSISVLILGETGVGKEVTAETIHRLSKRSSAPFVRLNCAALSETLIESELFGHEKGAFTGAVKAKPGLLETAEGGTVFLDEVGELPMSMQVKLLRVLEERMVLRVGALKPTAIDVRIVSATNRDLEREIQVGKYRQDLFFRLNGITIDVPPLRDRIEELAQLAGLFIEQICRQDDRTRVPSIAPDAMQHLVQYRWPGNIRELKNIMERAVLLSGGDTITGDHLPLEKMAPESTTHSRPMAAVTVPRGFPPKAITDAQGSLLTDMQRYERERVIKALEECGGNQTQAAKKLGIARRTLIKRLDRYNVPRPRKGRSEHD